MASPTSAGGRWILGVASLALLWSVFAAFRLDAPLLEGAAGKQTHTAMVARNLYRGTAALTRPRVDDVGQPGYFIKEIPVLAALAALSYDVSGGVRESWLRMIGAAAWLLALLPFAGLARRDLGTNGGLAAGFWFIAAPMSVTYGPSAMTDPLAVAASVGALAATSRWRDRPGPARAICCAALVGASAALKPHTAFWLGPASLLLVFARDREGRRAPGGPVALLGGVTSLAILAATAWYLHAASVHRDYPVPGATVAQGWVDVALLARPALYREVLRQSAWMVFTPVGLAIAGIGLARGGRLGLHEKAFAAWGLGVILQCFVFAPRMFDDLSRGTEYYQLALVPTAALFIARGALSIASWPRIRWVGGVTAAGALGLLLAGSARETALAVLPPAHYGALLSDCEQVQRLTAPTDTFVVFADRGGTVLYYCDRKGLVLTRAGDTLGTNAIQSATLLESDLSRALRDADFVYLPFPETGEDVGRLGDGWREVSLADSKARLFENARKRGRGRR